MMKSGTVSTLVLLLGVLLPAAAAQAPASPPPILLIDIDDAIQPITASFILEAIQDAAGMDAGLLIIKLDTPGGLVPSTEEIVEAMLHSKVPILVFVGGAKAASAGFFITIASDVAVMAPGTRIGAAHPVSLTGGGEGNEVMETKIVNDLAAYARTIAENRGRNVDLAEQAVRDSRSFTETEALEGHLIDFICADVDEILERVDGHVVKRLDGQEEVLRLAGAEVREKSMTLREQILSSIAHPSISLILLGIGILGLYMEFSNPGLIFPGVIGGIALLLFGMSVQILPINYIGLLFILLGIILFILEIKVISYGMLSVGGLVCFVFGTLILFEKPPVNLGLRVPLELVLAVSLTVGGLMAFLTYLVVRAHRRGFSTGQEGLVAETGTAVTDIDPEGKIFVHGEYWNARSERPIARGRRVRVKAVRDLVILVEEIDPAEF